MATPLTRAESEELERLYRALRADNYNGQTLARFRYLVGRAAQPEIERQIAARMPQIARRAAMIREAREAGRRAGVAAGRRELAKIQSRRRW